MRCLRRKIITPCGPLTIGEFDGRLCLCDWFAAANSIDRSSPLIDAAERQLNEYFSGKRREFDIPLHQVGTEFQLNVWRALMLIPYGETVSYADVAAGIGRPTAVRAVANAIGANKISIFIPCHRVIGSNGTLTGYAGGIPAKRLLLALESRS